MSARNPVVLDELCGGAVDPVDLLDAKARLLRLLQAVETGEEAEVVIVRSGKPVARLVPLAAPSLGSRIGVAEGAFEVPDDLDTENAEEARLLLGSSSRGGRGEESQYQAPAP